MRLTDDRPSGGWMTTKNQEILKRAESGEIPASEANSMVAELILMQQPVAPICFTKLSSIYLDWEPGEIERSDDEFRQRFQVEVKVTQ